MGTRLIWATGISGTILALLRVGRLLDAGDGGPPWGESLLVAAVLGVLVTAAVHAAQAPTWAVWLLNGVGAIVLALRRIAPETLSLGALPTQETVGVVGEQGQIAIQLIRFGAAPVVAVAGVVALLSMLFWGLGAAVAHGSLRSRAPIAVIPPLVVYLQFATFDRRPPGPWWTAAFLVVATAALVVTAPSLRARLGRARFTNGELVPRRSPGLLASLAVLGVVGGMIAGSAFAGTVPESGLLRWRTDSGIGTGLYGGGSPNVFVGLQQQLVDLSDEPVFYARFSENAPSRDLYWKLITLDSYDGEFWQASAQTFATQGRVRWERDDWRFFGPIERIAANIQIAGLVGSFLPTVYSPVALSSDEPLIAEAFRVREDGSIAVDVQALDGWTYQINADVPQPDLAALASEDGVLTPLFQAAVDAGEADIVPVVERTDPVTPGSVTPYVSLPDDVLEDVGPLAEELTVAGSTDFERALLLESFFRDPDEFTYSTEVDTGHTTLDLVEWITDPESVNFRTGYCEQFATAMAVMGRALGIPARVVVGFTPGEIQTQTDGSELVVVRERNAHAWVEMWMDDQGWVRFDPTPRGDRVNPSLGGDQIGIDAVELAPIVEESRGNAPSGGQPLIPDRLLEDRAGEAVPDFGPGGQSSGWRLPRDVAGWLAVVAALAAVVGAVPATKWIRRRRRVARIDDGDVEAAWREIVDRLVDLGDGPTPVDTPSEIARRSSEALVPLADRYDQMAYGGRTSVPCAVEFEAAERRLRADNEGRRWVASWLSPRSLIRR